MADYLLLGLFTNLTPTADAIDGLRELNIDDDQITIMSNVPYAPKFFGRKHPHQAFLPYVLGGALVGLVLGFFIAVVTPSIYPIEVGGQGLTPVPPSAIIIFELMSLCAMVAAFLGFLLQNRFPILARQIYDKRITEGYIGVQVQAAEGLAEQVEAVFEANGAIDVKRRVASDYPDPGNRHLVFWAGIGVLILILFLIPTLLSYDVVKLPWINTMWDSPGVGHQEGPRRAAPPDSIPIQGPVLIGGEPATGRLPDTDVSRQRGEMLFNINCVMCHGERGAGNGTLAEYFDPPVPVLNTEQVQDRPANDVFVIITNGLGRMPGLAENLSPGETWDVVNFVLGLDGDESSDAGQ